MQTTTEKRALEYILTNIFAGSVIKKAYPNRCKCRKCKTVKKSYKELDRHHITYKPKRLVWLCHRCHVRVTYLNTLKARSIGCKLGNAMRLEVWKDFLAEKIDDEVYDRSMHEMRNWFDR